MGKPMEAVEVKRIVVRVGKSELELTVEEARELHRVLGELVGAREPVVPIVFREVVTIPVVQPIQVPAWVPCTPYQPSLPYPYIGDPIGPFWQTTCNGSTVMVSGSNVND